MAFSPDGQTLASASFDEESGAKRPSVQIGDPFEEKKLIEACLELLDADLALGVLADGDAVDVEVLAVDVDAGDLFDRHSQ